MAPMAPILFYPLMTAAPMYNLPNGAKDTYDIITGKEIYEVGQVSLDGSEDWNMVSTGDETVMYKLSGLQNVVPGAFYHLNQGSLCSAFENIDIGDDAEGYGSDAAETTDLYVRIAKNRIVNWDDNLTDQEKTDIFKSYLSENMFEMLYQMEESREIQNQTNRVAGYSMGTVIYTDKGSLDVRYNKDADKVIKEHADEIRDLTGEIRELTDKIAELESRIPE